MGLISIILFTCIIIIIALILLLFLFERYVYLKPGLCTMESKLVYIEHF